MSNSSPPSLPMMNLSKLWEQDMAIWIVGPKRTGKTTLVNTLLHSAHDSQQFSHIFVWDHNQVDTNNYKEYGAVVFNSYLHADTDMLYIQRHLHDLPDDSTRTLIVFDNHVPQGKVLSDMIKQIKQAESHTTRQCTIICVSQSWNYLDPAARDLVDCVCLSRNISRNTRIKQYKQIVESLQIDTSYVLHPTPSWLAQHNTLATFEQVYSHTTKDYGILAIWRKQILDQTPPIQALIQIAKIQ